MTVYHTTLRGVMGEGASVDNFSHSLGIVSNADAATVAQAIHESWYTVMQQASLGLDSDYNASTQWTDVTVAQVLDPMVPDLSAATHAAFNPPIPGLGIAITLPQQTALAVSLKAGVRPNGTAFRGRFYLPAMQTTAVIGAGLLDPAIQQKVANAITGHFSRLTAQGHVPSIWSRTVEDLVQPIDEIRVGNKFDTIRRRRNDLPETYVSAAI
jgi:hypothetical protein